MTTLSARILESTVKQLHQLKDDHRGTLAEVVIDQEIRLRKQTGDLDTLTRKRTQRNEGDGG